MKKLLVLSTAPLIKHPDYYSAYSPYVKELEIWSKHSDEIHFCCPIWANDNGLLNEKIDFVVHGISPLKEFSINSFVSYFQAIKGTIINFKIIFNAFRFADHIHLRCPGNIGLISCMVQIFFPGKMKSTKYAGNWDPNSKQPWSYKLQKWILSNTFLTKNMQVLVYGEWPNQSKNIKPFFTATYSEMDKVDLTKRDLSEVIKFVFVGTLSEGKRPLYALQLLNELCKSGLNVVCDFYGEGSERELLENFISDNNLSEVVKLMGNQSQNLLIEAYQNSHFLLLPSKSEGWPKAVAEAMFWGCVPITTAISCVPFMVKDGERGEFLTLDLKKDTEAIMQLAKNHDKYQKMSVDAANWSRVYTIEKFEREISNVLQNATSL